VKKKYLLLFMVIIGCRKELDISEFVFNFSNYIPELRIEALILPHDSTAIVRIDKSYLINDTELYDCRDNDYGEISLDSCNTIEGAFWHGQGEDQIADCGDWNPFIHDLGIDGLEGDPSDDDGDCDDCSSTNAQCQENCRAEDSIGENNGVPDCNEPNVDNYIELLPNIHNSSCDVLIFKSVNSDIDSCKLIFKEDAGYFYNNSYTGDKRSSPIFDNIETINYGAYIPASDCSNNFWADYSAEYSFEADCNASGFGRIKSKEPITLSNPVVFIAEEDYAEIINCETHDCLNETSSIQSTADSSYFGRYAQDQKIFWANLYPTVIYQVVQYLFDKDQNNFKYYHGHVGFGWSEPGFQWLDIVVSGEDIVTEFYDGEGNGYWDSAETRTNDALDCLSNEIYEEDSDGGYCDRNFEYGDGGNKKWDDEEIYADVNENGQWDEGQCDSYIDGYEDCYQYDEDECNDYEDCFWKEEEYFIDSADGFPLVDTYFYEVFTFSDSYSSYYFNDQLYLDDVERTNLRDEGGNPVLGAFGSMTSAKHYFRIIDCTTYNDELSCEDLESTKSVCGWRENVSVYPCTGKAEDIDPEDQCLPINFSIEACSD